MFITIRQINAGCHITLLEVKIILYVCNEHFLSILRENIAHSQSKAQEEANEHQAKEAELLAHLESAQNEQRNAVHKCKGGWFTFIYAVLI